MIKHKAVYFIGGGELNIYAVKWARESGFKTIISDKNINFACKHLADFSVHANAKNYSIHIKYLNKLVNHLDIRGVICQIEEGLFTKIKIEKFLKLKTIKISSLNKSMDKIKQKKILEKSKLLIPKNIEIKNLNIFKKIILKPSDGSGSRGVEIIDHNLSKETIKKKISNLKKNFKNYILEEYIDGRSIDGNALLIDGKFYPAGVFEKFSTPLPYALPIAGEIPVNLPLALKKKFTSTFKKGCKALGIENGPVKIDTILYKNNFYILEITPRFHGDVSTQNIVPYATGINVFKFLYSYWSGKPNFNFISEHKRKYGLWRVILTPPKFKIKLVRNFNLHPSIKKIWINDKTSRGYIYKNTTQIPGYICVVDNSKKRAEEAILSLSQIFYKRRNEEAIKKINYWYASLLKTILQVTKDPKTFFYFNYKN